MSANLPSDLVGNPESTLLSNPPNQYSFNDLNIQINVTYSNGKPLHLKNVLLKAEEQEDFTDAMVQKKEASYNSSSVFKWLEYVDVRKIPLAMHHYFKSRYDVITTSKLTSQFFFEKLIRQQRFMLVYCKALGKYLLIYYQINVEVDQRQDYKLSEVLDKLEIKAVEICVANMLMEIYKNNALIVKQKAKILSERANTTDGLSFSENNRYDDSQQNHGLSSGVNSESNAVEELKADLKDVNLRMDDIMQMNSKLLEQNHAIREQNDMILRLLRERQNP